MITALPSDPQVTHLFILFYLQEAVKQLGSILKTNVRACKALGHPFVVQLGRIYLDMLNVYKVLIKLTRLVLSSLATVNNRSF